MDDLDDLIKSALIFRAKEIIHSIEENTLVSKIAKKAALHILEDEKKIDSAYNFAKEYLGSLMKKEK